MPFYLFLTAALENILNLFLQENPELVHQNPLFKGQVLQIYIRDYDLKLTFIFSSKVDVLGHYESSPDCYLSLPLSVVTKMRRQANITNLMKRNLLEFEGDIKLAQNFITLLVSMRLDIEELLSRFTGDVLARDLVSLSRSISSMLVSKSDRYFDFFTQTLTEEWKITPSSPEGSYFFTQVDGVSKRTERLEVRLLGLIENLWTSQR